MVIMMMMMMIISCSSSTYSILAGAHCTLRDALAMYLPVRWMIINLDPIQSECWKETKTDAADRSFSWICQALVCGCEATCERAAVETSARVWMSTLQDETVRHRRIMMNIFF